MKWKRETLKIIFVPKESIWLPIQQDVLLPSIEANLPFNYMLITIQLLCKGIRSLGALRVEDVKSHRTLWLLQLEVEIPLIPSFQKWNHTHRENGPPQAPLPSTTPSPQVWDSFLCFMLSRCPAERNTGRHVNWDLQVFYLPTLHNTSKASSVSN